MPIITVVALCTAVAVLAGAGVFSLVRLLALGTLTQAGFFLVAGSTIVFLLFIAETVRIAVHLLISKSLTDTITKFERLDPTASKRVLFIGDSTGYGTGASNERYSIVGRIGTDFPDAYIENASLTGSYLSRALKVLGAKSSKNDQEKYDLIIIMLGGINLAHGTPLWLIRRTLRKVIPLGKLVCRGSIVLVSPYNFGLAPLYRFPLSLWYQKRAKALDALYSEVANEEHIIHISHFQEHSDPLFERHLYASDKTHPNDEGYGILYSQMKDAIEQAL